MKKRILSLALVLALAFSLLPVPAVAAQAQTTTHIIESEEDLIALGGTEITGDVELACDLNMAGRQMQPIAKLTGTFDGNGYTISNLSLSGAAGTMWDPVYTGLIAELDGTVRNVVVENITITADQNYNHLGTLVGVIQADESSVENCRVSGAITSTHSTGTIYLGGLIGYVNGASVTIENCVTDVALTGTGTDQLGGMIGYIGYASSAAFENSAVLGDVAAGSSSGRGGGFIGSITSVSGTITLKNSFLGAKVTGGKKGGIAYVASGTPSVTVSDTFYYDKEKNPDSSAYSPFEMLPKSSGAATLNGTAVGKTTAEFGELVLEGFVSDSTGGYPVPAWTADLAESGRSLTVTAPGAKAVTLSGDHVLSAQGETDANGVPASGRFAIEGISTGVYTYSATSGTADRGDATGKLVVGKIRENSKTIVLPEKVPTYAVVLAVTPVHAEVTLSRGTSAGGETVTASSSENGAWTYELEAGDYYYTAAAFGYESGTGTFQVSQADRIEISLVGETTSDVTFAVDAGGETASVSVKHGELVMQPKPDNALCFALPDGEYTYTVSAPGHLPKEGSFTVPGTTQLALTLEKNTAWDGTLAQSLEGEGSEQSPYLIHDGRELALLAQKVNDGDAAYSKAYVELAGDIDLGDVSWTPLGSKSVNPFMGHFDGKGYTVSGLNVEEAFGYYGFFGCLVDATVENLTVDGEVYCPEPYGRVGGLTGYARGNVVIRNCTNLATVSSLARGGEGIGGLVGGYDDNVEYQWVSVSLQIENSCNAGLIVCTGADAERKVGGLVGANKNCVQLKNSYNLAPIYAPDVWAAGLLGEAGSQTGNCYPSITDCYNTGTVTGATGKSFALYGKGTIAQSRIAGSYSLAGAAADAHAGTAVADLESIRTLAQRLGHTWPEVSEELLTESLKYSDVIAAPSGTSIPGKLTLLKDGETADPDVELICSQSADDIQSGYLQCADGAITLIKANMQNEAVTETATLRWSRDGRHFRKPVSVVIYPSASVRATIANNIANSYVGKSGDWVVFDMAAYEKLGLGEAKTSEAARQNYLDLTINALQSSSALVTDRAKAEIVLAAIGVDSTQLTALDGTVYNNAEKLRTMDLGSSYYAAPWVLLADEQGNVNLSESQIQRMVSLLTGAQGDNGLFYSIWGNEKYDDVDTTGTALAALARFYLAQEDPYGVKSSVTDFVDRALTGLSAAQGANGSYGNVNSDAMVVTGLVALGIDPGSDPRFVKNGCSLSDALMLYVNESATGFTAGYVSGEQGEKAQALATEQGFRALVALESFEERNGVRRAAVQPFNIYCASDVVGGEPVLTPAGANSVGKVEASTELPESDTNVTVVFTVLPDESSSWLASSVTMPEGSSVAHLLQKAFADADMTCDGLSDGYIKSITKGAVTLAQFDRGPNSGWMFKVNGKMPSVGIDDCILKTGDQVVFYYTDDWSRESGTDDWGAGGTTVTAPSATLTPKASVDADGNATASVTAAEVKSAAAAGGQVVIIPADADGADSVGVTLANGAAQALADAKVGVSVQTAVGSVALTAAGAQQLAAEGGEVRFSLARETSAAEETDTFTVEVKVGSRTLETIDGGIRVNLPAGTSSVWAVVAAVQTDGSLAVIPKSAVDKTGAKALLDGTATLCVIDSPRAFSDVREGDWFESNVAFAVARGLFQGVSETQFAPNDPMTRAMFVTVVHRLEGLPAGGEGRFDDVPAETWYFEAVNWAAENGIVDGKGDGFLPEDFITRQELAVMMFRYANTLGMDRSESAELSRFSDGEKTADWAREAMQWAVGSWLVTGREGAVLDPTGTASRAEVATMLQRLIQALLK
ncbi:S-layer homology domain-containing protein [Feifania hominis]|uniref:S-layer homology domain-containing protein n=1 Tax=Feifania hominis TaxID=2763660 RepID=A0A926DEK2_9FIRM|nr:S-layer homology domain-containing protein [Feifania hominis]MBC8536407.1 S-layer homology domain-containing protein [Feifania hominis]